MSKYVNMQNVHGYQGLQLCHRVGNIKKTWHARIYLNGKEQYKSLRTTSKPEATTRAIDFYEVVKKGIILDKKTFKEVFEHYLEYVKNSDEYTDNQHRDYRNTFRQIDKFKQLNNVIIYEFDESHVMDWVVHRKDNNKSLSAINTEISHLNQFFAYCKERKMIPEKREFGRVKNKKYVARASFSQEEITKIESLFRKEWDEKLKKMSVENQFFDLENKAEENYKKRFEDDEYETMLMLRVLFYFMIGCGCRPKTLQRIKVGGIKKDRYGVYGFIGITEKGKIRKDPIFLRKKANHMIDELLAFHEFRGSDPRSRLLTRTTNYLSRLFKAFLVKHGYVENEYDEERVMYSVRHYYISTALESLPVALVCSNAQTSISTIEKYYNKTSTKKYSRELSNF